MATRGDAWARTPWWLRVLLGGAFAYCTVVVALLVFEDELIYVGAGIDGGDWNPAGLDFEDARFEAHDGVVLHGWLLAHPEPKALILHCHGNGINVSHAAREAAILRDALDASVLVFDYRGYGQSAGEPSERGILADGEAAMSWLSQRYKVSPDEVVVIGVSLGGAVAAHVAATQGARALVLERTFSNLPDAAARIYWWAPVRLLMRTRLDSMSKVRLYRGPLLQSHGDRDEMIPLDLAQRLFDASVSEPKTFVTLDGVGHNGPDTQAYWETLKRFIRSTAQPPAEPN